MSIPQQIKANLCLIRADHYVGEIDPAGLHRLSAELAAASPPIQAELGFRREVIGDWLRGRIRGSLVLTCQRCLMPFAWPLDVTVDLRLVRSDAEAEEVLQQADPYLVEDDRLPLVDIVEEEVLLALPMLPRCSSCESAVVALQSQAEEPVAEGRPNPFAKLKHL